MRGKVLKQTVDLYLFDNGELNNNLILLST